LDKKIFSADIEASSVQVPRIASVRMLKPQPHENDPEIIWYDDFDGSEKEYSESIDTLDTINTFG